MQKKIAHISIDISPPEKAKFRSHLILVHGLWSGSWCWSQWATRFTNLGWECWAINFRGRVEGEAMNDIVGLTFEHCVEDLKRLIRAAGAAPILIAHSLGGLVTLKAAEQERIAALIMLSPPHPGTGTQDLRRSLRLLRLKYILPLYLGWPITIKDKDFALNWLSSLPVERHGAILRDLVPESSHLVKMLFQPVVPVKYGLLHCPVLVLGGTEDRVVPVESIQRTARMLGAETREYPGHGHWMMGEEGWEEIVNDSHRWLVQSLGEAILLDQSDPRP